MLEPVSRNKLSLQMFDALVLYISSNRLAPGDALPSTAALGEQFGASRPVVREALSALEAIGLVEITSGRNAVVRDLDGHLISLFLGRALHRESAPLTALMEVRVPLEVQAASLAAERASAESIEILGALIDRMELALGDTELYPRLDALLHLEIARAADNSALTWFTESVGSKLFETMVEVRSYREQNRLVGAEQDQHRAIVAAIRAHDPVAARTAMSTHMESTMALVVSLDARSRAQ
ncbi:FadR family transcriptional regulator [Mycetocola tolaasinivorans]|uniref:FadR family transcriptional regulator n=1 Tax=Mycetocola tolaasinivorans TaxID=76635 RepID=A0A3L7ADW7_9MICO|nr:FadR/GntR family transcriptional regulator [Mycetocola tolaasinivorans]RLP78000.1 FadR family transcriptional regulator [Mycetocola tolaasinivorans]